MCLKVTYMIHNENQCSLWILDRKQCSKFFNQRKPEWTGQMIVEINEDNKIKSNKMITWTTSTNIDEMGEICITNINIQWKQTRNI